MPKQPKKTKPPSMLAGLHRRKHKIPKGDISVQTIQEAVISKLLPNFKFLNHTKRFSAMPPVPGHIPSKVIPAIRRTPLVNPESRSAAKMLKRMRIPIGRLYEAGYHPKELYFTFGKKAIPILKGLGVKLSDFKLDSRRHPTDYQLVRFVGSGRKIGVQPATDDVLRVLKDFGKEFTREEFEEAGFKEDYELYAAGFKVKRRFGMRRKGFVESAKRVATGVVVGTALSAAVLGSGPVSRGIAEGNRLKQAQGRLHRMEIDKGMRNGDPRAFESMSSKLRKHPRFAGKVRAISEKLHVPAQDVFLIGLQTVRKFNRLEKAIKSPATKARRDLLKELQSDPEQIIWNALLDIRGSELPGGKFRFPGLDKLEKRLAEIEPGRVNK